ncbi:MAG TPA: TIGR01777 family oxidoreductase [Patescibacteria group bacterium]|nr:TIGR01777 family oxidoreductase [Patescibacteria group bacterium]
MTASAGTVAVSGGRGLVGSALTEALAGARVVRLARPGSGNGNSVLFDPKGGSIDAVRLEGCDAVVHLAGEPIAAGRWNASRKEKILHSRVEGTRLLVDGLSRIARRPRVLVCASAIGYYGNRADEELKESSSPGDDFLAKVVRQWEAEAGRAASLGIRVVTLRLGIVLSAKGGALARMLTPFKLGLGGRLGDGRQWMSWIHIEDLVRVILFALQNEALSGPVNAVAPEPARNADFTVALAGALHRPALMPAPAFALRLALGEMADALLLSSARVVPGRLAEAGFAWKFPRLEAALGNLVGRG